MSLQNQRTTRSNPTLIPPMSEPEHFICNVGTSQSIKTVYRPEDEVDSHTGAGVAQQSLEEAFEMINDKSQKQTAPTEIANAAHPDPPIEVATNSHICELVQSMVMEEVNRIYSEKIQAATTQATEKALVDLLQTGFGAATDGVKTASYRFIENVLTEMAHQGSLNTFFERNFDR